MSVHHMGDGRTLLNVHLGYLFLSLLGVLLAKGVTHIRSVLPLIVIRDKSAPSFCMFIVSSCKVCCSKHHTRMNKFFARKRIESLQKMVHVVADINRGIPLNCFAYKTCSVHKWVTAFVRCVFSISNHCKSHTE